MVSSATMPRCRSCKPWDGILLALHTVWYSHKGHPEWFGEVTVQTLFEQFLSYAFQARHLNVTTVLSGYLGSAAQALALARALPARVRYVCDPVMGDTPGGQYVGDDLVRAYREQLLQPGDNRHARARSN